MLDPRTCVALLLALGLTCGAQACSAPAAPDPTSSSSASTSSGITWGNGGGSTSGTGGGSASAGTGGLPAEGEGLTVAGGVAAPSGFSLKSTVDLGGAPDPLGPGSLAVDGDGNTVVLGHFTDTLDLGSGVTLSLPGEYGCYLAKLSPTGQALWARTVPLLGNRVFTDASSSIWISDNTNHSTVTRHDASGAEVWSKTFHTLGPLKIVPTGGGSAIVADLLLESSLDYGTGSIEKGPAMIGDLFMIKVDALGGVLWGRALGEQVWPAPPAPDEQRSIKVQAFAPAPGGGMMLLVQTHLQGGTSDILLLRIDGSGAIVWRRSFPRIAHQDPTRLVVDAAGNALVALTVGGDGGPGDLGCGELPYGLALAMTDPDGKPRWTRYFHTVSTPVNASFDPGGNLLISADFIDPIDLGGGVLPPASVPSASRIVVAKLSPDGAHLASRAFGGSMVLGGPTQVRDAAVNPEGDLLVALTYTSPLDLGSGPLPEAPAPVGLLARFKP